MHEVAVTLKYHVEANSKLEAEMLAIHKFSKEGHIVIMAQAVGSTEPTVKTQGDEKDVRRI